MCIHSHDKLLPIENASALGVGRTRVRTETDHLAVNHGCSPTVASQRNEPHGDCREAGKQPSRKGRSRSLPTNQLDAEESDDPSNLRPRENIQQQPPVPYADISKTHRRHRKKVKPVKYQRPRYLSNTGREETDSDIDHESTSLLTSLEWTAAERHGPTSVQIETQL